MVTNIVIATHNHHKYHEIKDLMNSRLCNINLLSLDDINCTENIPEDHNTLEGNALQKANYIYCKYKMNCFADDTGLEIESLNGEPGVFSARYAGENVKNFDDNINKVLSKLSNKTNRNAQFRTIVALILEGKKYFFEGIVKGKIIYHKKGEEGFGYDSIFVPDGYDKTFAEMSMEEKNKISHRAMAINKLMDFLYDYYK